MVSGPGGQLYITTSNGNNDRVIRISPATPTVSRLAGSDRYATAAAISEVRIPRWRAHPSWSPRAEDFPDALAGSAAAGRFGMPILLVQQNAIPACNARPRSTGSTRNEIYVLGGLGVVSEAVRTGPGAVRIDGGGPRVWPAPTATPLRRRISSDLVCARRPGRLHRHRGRLRGRPGRRPSGRAQRLAAAAGRAEHDSRRPRRLSSLGSSRSGSTCSAAPRVVS